MSESGHMFLLNRNKLGLHACFDDCLDKRNTLRHPEIYTKLIDIYWLFIDELLHIHFYMESWAEVLKTGGVNLSKSCKSL